MNYFGYMPNDFINGTGVSVSLWTAGCPHRCPGCHNKEMWDYNNGYEIPNDIEEQICQAIQANGIQRNFSVLGGEPLSLHNLAFVNQIISKVRNTFPTIKIYLWTGFTYEELQGMLEKMPNISYIKDLNSILAQIDVLIEGRYIEKLRDITLPLRGSSNQRIIEMKE